MPTNFPTSLDTTTNLPITIADATTQATNHPAYHNTEDGALIALETKLGVGASTPTSGLILTGGVTPGTSSWTSHTHLMPVILASAAWDFPTGADTVGVGFSLGACTITAVRAIRTGGTAATGNFRLRGTTNVLSSSLTINTTYTVTTTLASTALADTDRIEAMLVSITGAPTRVELFLIGTRASQ